MYQRLIRRRIQGLYDALSCGDPTPILDAFGSRFAYTFVGDGHPLSGTRHRRAQVRGYLERALRLFPGVQFDVRDIVVDGKVWNTRVAVVIDVRAQLPDGTPYENEIIQLLCVRWGRLVRARTVIDTMRLSRALQRLHDLGVEEATAPPLC